MSLRKSLICCGYSKERSDRDTSFEHLKHMFLKTDGEEINHNFTLFLLLVAYLDLNIVLKNPPMLTVFFKVRNFYLHE